MTFLLYVEDPATGYIRVMSFASQFDRALHLITLSSQPLILRTQDY